MCKVNGQSDEKRPLSVYVLIAAVIVLDLALVYWVNVEWLPLLFGLDRALVRQGLITVVVQTTTTAVGVFLGLLGFHALGWPSQKPCRGALQEGAPVRGIEPAEESRSEG